MKPRIKADELDALAEMLGKMNWDLSVRSDGDTTTLVFKRVKP